MISTATDSPNTIPFCPFPDSSSEESLEKLEEEITYLAGFINAATCRFLLLVAEFDRRDGWRGVADSAHTSHQGRFVEDTDEDVSAETSDQDRPRHG